MVKIRSKVKKLHFTKDEIVKMFHLDKVSAEEIRLRSIDYRFTSKNLGPTIQLDENMRVILEEAKRTFSYREVIRELCGLFSIGRWQVIEKREENDVKVMILASKIGVNKTLVVDGMKDCGWFLVGEQDVKMNGEPWIILSFDPMFQDDIYNIVMECRRIYHWTPLYALETILKNGLVPRSENKLGNHPERVYFFSDNIPDRDLIDFGRAICRKNKDPRNDKRYALLYVETKDLKKVPFSYDPHADQAFFTTEKIDPSILHIEKKYDFGANQKIEG